MRVLLVILHKILLLAIGVYWLGEYFLTQLRTFLSTDSRNLEEDKKYIEQNIKGLNKLPGHVAVLLGEEMPDANVLTRLILWIATAGIDHVSIYDHKGQLGKVRDKVRLQVDRARDSHDQLIWGEDFHDRDRPMPHKNGYRKRLVIHLLEAADAGKSVAVQTCQNVAKDFKNGDLKDVSVASVDERMRKSLWGLPDPDLALYFGGICGSFGLSPWHLRLTEFLDFPPQRRLSAKDFVWSLYRYSKCEQRFGK